MSIHRRAVPAAKACVLLGAVLAQPVSAEIVETEVSYSYAGKDFTGVMVHDDALEGPRPGVLVVHEWWGLNDYARERARKLAELGYVAFAADMYGEGASTEHPDEARAFMQAVTMNTTTWRGRARKALSLLAESPLTDAEHLAAIGYCFGGSTVLQLAYSGADIDAVVSFHGGLPAPSAEDAKAIASAVFVAHGQVDPFVPPDQLSAFRNAMDAAGAEYTLVEYEGAMHSFTVPAADLDDLEGTVYSAEADAASWDAMKTLFDEVFAD